MFVMLPLVLLPGLDGTGKLYSSFVQAAPSGVSPVVVPLPELGAYDELIEAICSRLPSGRFAILGESFSGPIAVAVACRIPERVIALIVCNSFVSAPLARIFQYLPWRFLFSIPVPDWAIRWFLVGRSAPTKLVTDVRCTIAAVPPRLLAARMRSVFALPRPNRSWRIAVPVLSLSASHDVLVGGNDRELEAIATEVVHQRVPGPHLLLQAAPEAAWREISAFLSGITSSTREE